MRLMVLSDLHLGHKLMHDLGVRPSNYEDKIFKGLEILRSDDVFVCFGDITIGNKDKDWHERLMEVLPCKKWLIKGNHDRKSYGWYLNYWDFVGETVLLKRHGINILLSHKPQPKEDYFDINVHGHIHHDGHVFINDEYHILIELESNLNLRNLDSLVQKRLRANELR